jgi:VWFA-related protein
MKGMVLRFLTGVCLAATLGGAVQDNSPLLSSEGREVVLDVIARDKHGRIVKDLRPEELRVTDDGHEVTLGTFRLIRGAEAPGGAARSTDPNLIILLFEHFGPEGRVRAREGALALVKNAAGPNVYFSVLTVDTQLRAVEPFTRDVKQVQAAIERITSTSRRETAFQSEQSEQKLRSIADLNVTEKRLLASSPEGGIGRSAEPILARMMLNVLQPSESISRDVRGGPAVRALLALAREERALTGRKTLIYFSEGLQVPESQRPQFKEILEAANRSHLSVYPMDVSGLDFEMEHGVPSPLLAGASAMNMQAPAGRVAAPSRGGDAPQNRTIRSTDLKMTDISEQRTRNRSRSFLADLADSTGGFLVTNTNDLRGPARRIAEEALTYYEVTYTPPPGPLDGRFHPVSVTTSRSKTSIQSRDGYVAVPTVHGKPARAFELPLFKELSSQVVRHEFAHNAALVPLRQAPEGIEHALLVETPLGELHVEEDPQAGVCRMHGAALAILRDAQGKVIDRFSMDAPFRGALDREEAYRKSPWLMEEKVVLPPGIYSLETVVADKLGSRVSARRQRITVDPWGAGPHVSGLAYVRRVVPATPGAPRAFQSADKVVEPGLDERLAGGSGSAATIHFLIQSTQGSKGPLRVEAEIIRGSETVSRGTLFQGAVAAETPLTAKLDCSSLAGGEYDVRVTATDGAMSASASLPLIVAGHAAPVEAASAAPENRPPESLQAIATKAAEWSSSPPTEEQKKLIEVARNRALRYAEGLPDFMALQTTRRLEDPTGREEWRQKDEYSEMVTWQNGHEQYSYVGGRNRNRTAKDDAKNNRNVFVSSGGEFGSLLRIIFTPESNAEFRWLRDETEGNRATQVFAYRVEEKNSQYTVSYIHKQFRSVKPAYSGTVTIDAATGEVVWLEAIFSELPDDFEFQGLHLDVHYNAATVAGREYLLPSSATLTMRAGKRHLVRNEIQFSGYRRFETESQIRYRGVTGPSGTGTGAGQTP